MTDNHTIITNEARPYYGKIFTDKKGREYYFFGVVDGKDDYYYGIWNRTDNKLLLLSCVGSLESWFDSYGYTWVDELTKIDQCGIMQDNDASALVLKLQARIAELEREISCEEDRFNMATDMIADLAFSVERVRRQRRRLAAKWYNMRKERDSLRRDAERYRFIRSQHEVKWGESCPEDTGEHWYVTGFRNEPIGCIEGELDAAIDDARKEQK